MQDNFITDYNNAKAHDEAIFKGKTYRITILSDILVRVEYSENGEFEDRPTELAIFRKFDKPQMQVSQNEKTLNIKTAYFELTYVKESNIVKSNANTFKIKLVGTEKEWFVGAPEVRNFYGTLPSLDDVTGKIPLLKGLFSIDGYVSVDDSNSLIFEENGALGKGIPNRFDKYIFLYRKDFGNCLRDYFKLTGHPPMIPRYALGIWWNRNTLYSSASVRELVDTFNKHKIPFSTLVLGDDWHIRNIDKYRDLITGYSFNRELFPKPDELIEYLHNKDIHLGLKINPSQGIMPHEEGYNNLVAALGREKDKPIPYNTFDFEFQKKYFESILKPLNTLGVDFFWLDYYNKESLSSLRALNYFHFNSSVIDKKKRGMILSRNGLTASHRYPVHYSGQTMVSWSVLKFLPYFNSCSTNAGLAWWSHDIGGFKGGIEDDELYIRYVQLGTFSPIFRFACKDGKYYKREPWAWEIKTESIVREYTRLRHQLIPYLYTESYKYHKHGVPFIQPVYYRYPDTYDEPAFVNEYFFGSELFVCPITNKIDVDMKRVVERNFIPDGMWYEFISGKKIPGGKVYRMFYKENDYPVFAKAGAIIPQAVLDDKKLNNTNNPTAFEVHIFPGQSNSYKMFEDDGISTLYKEGYYMVTEFKYTFQPNNFSLTIKPIEGMEGLVSEKRTFRIRFRNTKYPQNLEVKIRGNVTNVPAYTDGKDFIVEVPFINTYEDVLITCSGNDVEIDAKKLISEDIESILKDIAIDTGLKEKIAEIIFGTLPTKKKSLEITKLKRQGLSPVFIAMFRKLVEYLSDI